MDTPPGEPEIKPAPPAASPEPPKPADPAAVAAPPASPGQDQPPAPAQKPPEDAPPPALTDEQLLQALRDPRAAALIDFVTGADGSPPAPAGPQPPTPAASPPGESHLAKVTRLAAEGDIEGVKEANLAEEARLTAATATDAAASQAANDAQRQMLGALAKVPELQELNASQTIRLTTALKQGADAFVVEAGNVIAEKRGAGPVRTPEQVAAAAKAAGEANAGVVTPDLPEGSPAPGEGPPIPTGEEAKGKDGYTVLSEFFAFEDNQSSLTPSV